MPKEKERKKSAGKGEKRKEERNKNKVNGFTVNQPLPLLTPPFLRSTPTSFFLLFCILYIMYLVCSV